ncbi:MAG: hypothetical protein MZW92_06115 [Comamonadaceae bacterium]|nr:hypothetical protein [Comamonadaceae bacterium]
MASAAPVPPGAAAGADAATRWARDYNEVKALGGRTARRRSAEQTEIARFWEYSLPAIYHGVVRSVADCARARRGWPTRACTRRWRRPWTTR